MSGHGRHLVVGGIRLSSGNSKFVFQLLFALVESECKLGLTKYSVFQSNHGTRCTTTKRVTSFLGLSPRHCARATQLLLKKYGKGAAVASRWQLCVRFDQPEI